MTSESAKENQEHPMFRVFLTSKGDFILNELLKKCFWFKNTEVFQSAVFVQTSTAYAALERFL